jgi:hypothetical protein
MASSLRISVKFGKNILPRTSKLANLNEILIRSSFCTLSNKIQNITDQKVQVS